MGDYWKKLGSMAVVVIFISSAIVNKSEKPHIAHEIYKAELIYTRNAAYNSSGTSAAYKVLPLASS